MDSELVGAIDVLAKRVDAKSRELAEMKKMVNGLCREAGREPMYSDIEAELQASTGGSARLDEYYGKSPLTACREYLEKRQRAATVEEIKDALTRGGMHWENVGWPENKLTNNLAISMSKNSGTFHRLPNGTYGLLKFYPDAAKLRKAAKESADDGDDSAKEGKTKTANDSNSGE